MPDDRIASQARVAASHFECKKNSLRQVQSGEWIISLTVLDLPSWLMGARMGTRLMAALVEIGDDETPILHEVPAPAASASERAVSGQPSTGTAPGREHRSVDAKERYRQQDDMEQARTRAALLCKDAAFQRWICDIGPRFGAPGEEMAAKALRIALNVTSRSQIASKESACDRFLALETEWKLASGQMPEQR